MTAAEARSYGWRDADLMRKLIDAFVVEINHRLGLNHELV
jgi:hypothetical protein